MRKLLFLFLIDIVGLQVGFLYIAPGRGSESAIVTLEALHHRGNHPQGVKVALFLERFNICELT